MEVMKHFLIIHLSSDLIDKPVQINELIIAKTTKNFCLFCLHINELCASTIPIWWDSGAVISLR